MKYKNWLFSVTLLGGIGFGLAVGGFVSMIPGQSIGLLYLVSGSFIGVVCSFYGYMEPAPNNYEVQR